eukprot:3876-Eustigmatos_ZCMA.PRE.1
MSYLLSTSSPIAFAVKATEACRVFIDKPFMRMWHAPRAASGRVRASLGWARTPSGPPRSLRASHA